MSLATALISYISKVFPNESPVLQQPIEFISDSVLRIDHTTLKSLEITKCMNMHTKKGSLLSIIDKTKTPAGMRLLSSRLIAPSTCIQEINRRLDLVNEWFIDTHLLSDTRELLTDCKDIERSLQRMNTDFVNPKDYLAVISTLKKAMKLKDYLSSNNKLKYLLTQMADLNHLVKKSENILTGESSEFDGIVCNGVSPLLDEMRDKALKLKTVKLKLTVKIVEELGFNANDLGAKFSLMTNDFGPVCELKVSGQYG